MFKQVGPNNFVLIENLNDPDSDQSKELRKKIEQAAETQRQEPEHTMLSCQFILQKANGSAALINSIEHVGDLAHRAQAYNAIYNVEEKVDMMLKYWSSYRWPLEKEIKHGILNNCAYRYANESGLYDKLMGIKDGNERAKAFRELEKNPEVLKMVDHAYSEMDRALKMYVSAHRQFNLPITKLGLLGKNAAIALGELNYNKLHDILIEMKQWLEKYKSSSETEKWKMYSELI
jgi:hypothetical protein